MVVGGVIVMVYFWIPEENFVESILFFYLYVSFGGGRQITMLQWEALPTAELCHWPVDILQAC